MFSFYMTVFNSYWKCVSRLVVSDSLQPMDCSPPGSSSPGKNTGVGCCSLLQGIFPTQGSNPDLPHCSRFLTIWATINAQLIKMAHTINIDKWLLNMKVTLYEKYIF